MSKKNLKSLCKHIASCKSEKQVEDFLEAILSPKELIEIPTRLEIIKLLKAGLPQREIAESLGVGIATITRGARELKQGKFKNI
ncbi:MAG: Trp family transcriptional regulator [Bdellovibrionota bacterium]